MSSVGGKPADEQRESYTLKTLDRSGLSGTAEVPFATESPTSLEEKYVDTQPASFNPGWRFMLAFGSICIISLMAALDATSLSVAIPTITRDIGGTAIQGFWSGTSFLLTSTVFQPIFGSFSEIFGRKPMLMVSLVLFGLGSIIAAVAKRGMDVLLAGRAIQGAGGAGILALSEILITDLVPLRFRGDYFSIEGSMWAIGSVSGPIIGGAFAEKVSWRWIFLINLPILAVGVPMIIIFLKLRFRASSIWAKLRRIDWFGGFLFIASSTGILIPLSSGGTMQSWSSWHTLFPLTISSMGMICFIIWEEKCAVDPLIRTRVMKNANAASTYFGVVIQGLTLWSLLYYQPLYFLASKNASAIQSAIDLFPGTLTTAPAAIVVGVLITKWASYRWAIWIGWALNTLGTGLRILQNTNTSTAAWVSLNLVSGVGAGMLYPSTMYALQAVTADEDQPYAVTLFSFFRSAGQAIGVAVGGAIFQNIIKREIAKHSSIATNAAAWSRDATALIETIGKMRAGNAKSDLIESYTVALKWVWIVMTVFCFLGFTSSLWTKHYDLDRQLQTEQGFIDNSKVPDSESHHKTTCLQSANVRRGGKNDGFCNDQGVAEDAPCQRG